MYNPKDIINVIAGNVRKTKNPFGIPKFMCNRWWKESDVPSSGEALLFTGLMYQFVPYIEKSTAYLQRFEDTSLAGFVRYAGYMPSYLSGIGLSMMTSGREKKKFNNILSNIAKILSASKVDFYYQPDLDDYSGILLYDLGDQEGFEKHAMFVAEKLKNAGIKKLITVDPHTTYAMKVLYPKYTGISFEVKTYFELVSLNSKNGHRKVTLHDPCFYGRYLELSDVPEKLLSGMGIECVPVRNSGQFTRCCGGPAESISPKLSGEVAGRRLEELNGTGAPLIAMCPICLANLIKEGAEVEDLSTLLARYI